jgi:hypothetical protein
MTNKIVLPRADEANIGKFPRHSPIMSRQDIIFFFGEYVKGVPYVL